MLLIQFLLIEMTMSRTGFEPAPPANFLFYSDGDFGYPRGQWVHPGSIYTYTIDANKKLFERIVRRGEKRKSYGGG